MIGLIEAITLALIPGFLLLDFVVQKRKFNKTKHWRLRGFLVSAAIILFSGEVALFWGKIFGDFHLFNLTGLGMFAGAVTGVVIYEVCHYWYHRKAHEWNWLWRAGHQMHHSAESLDSFGAFYQHPFDAIMFTTIISVVFFPLLGLSIEAAVVGALFLTFNAMFQHANINTPYWLGYVVQRPESHTVQHATGIHRHNYSDLPVIDLLFGTLVNPRDVSDLDCGFYPGASSRILEMLVGVDVSKPKQRTELLEVDSVAV